MLMICVIGVGSHSNLIIDAGGRMTHRAPSLSLGEFSWGLEPSGISRSTRQSMDTRGLPLREGCKETDILSLGVEAAQPCTTECCKRVI